MKTETKNKTKKKKKSAFDELMEFDKEQQIINDKIANQTILNITTKKMNFCDALMEALRTQNK